MTSQKKEPCKEQEKEEKKPIKKTEKLKHEEEHVGPTLNIGNQLKILIQEFSWEGEDDRSTLDTQEMEQHELVYIMNIKNGLQRNGMKLYDEEAQTIKSLQQKLGLLKSPP